MDQSESDLNGFSFLQVERIRCEGVEPIEFEAVALSNRRGGFDCCVGLKEGGIRQDK